ncbi:uncharacterized protein N7458_004341 [Penicillium daleae]|uniref:Uncharacterized protein n=1 Tax=Penicillium daleae TaxID=63821 RepID=A0AAD6CCD3_9EURO|nr:uncharacterized protein N7458_004341 [Penicillium daleae]KAJ5456077.1 hypothetical protein N7458_004341 [Penicillium daleae]
MDASDNPLGHRTNILAAQRLQFYQGCVIIELHRLKFELNSVLGSRSLDERNVARIHKIFEIEGCGNLEPEHRVAALIDQETLSRALLLSDLSRESLLDPTNQPLLLLEGDVQLICVYGKHRLKAAELFGERRWLVDLYLDAIPSEALTQLREESAKSLDLTDGEIYRTLRLYQISQNSAQERKWRAKLKSDGRRQDIRRLQRDTALLESLDRLLPFLLHRYLSHIHERWSRIFEGEDASFVDPTSVHLVEGLMPQNSLEDRRRILNLVESRQIFALVTGVSQRQAMRERLLSTPGRIISLNTLTQDTLFLEEPAKALRHLCPKFTGSFRQVMLRHWSIDGSTFEIQKSEHKFGTMQQSANSFPLCMMQLWLFAFRHFIHQQRRAKIDLHDFGWSTEDHSLRKLAKLAERLGFKTEEITALANEDIYKSIAKGFIESLCREEFYIIEERRVQYLSGQLHKILRNLPRYSEEDLDAVEFTTINPEAAATNRFNCPTRDQHDQQRKHLFLEKVFGQSQPSAQYPTSLGVTREILYCFFGDIQTMISSQTDTVSEGYTEQISLQPNQGTLIDAPTALNPIISRLEALVEETEPNLDIIMTEQIETNEVPPDQSSSRYSRSPDTRRSPDARRSPDLRIITRDSPSEPVEMETYPSGTPDPPPPLASGFEDLSCIGPMESKNYLSVRHRIPEILRIWFQSQREVIVIFLFEFRTYYKLSTEGGLSLRLLLQDLSREHIFILINEFGIGTPDINKTYEAAMKERLLLVSRRENPAQGKNEVGLISLDRLQEYVSNYDIQTGKRKRNIDEGSGKRRPGLSRQSSEDDIR